MPDFLHIHNASIGYEQPLISDVNASLNCGAVTLLIGNNGIGKTTLIKTLVHQIKPLQGEILLEGKPLSAIEAKEIAQRISIVFSKAQIPSHYTTRDLVSLGKYIHLPYYFKLEEKDHAEVEAILTELGLKQYAEWPLKKLSDGNLQKAFIGRALAQNSPLIILDEPTTHLDEENKIMILKLLRNLARKHHKAILFSSHDWRLAKEFADQIWYIQNGKLQQGMAEDVLLQNNLLTHPKLFTLSEDFKPPQIAAPFLEKEMLYSALQKNFEKDLSHLTMEYCHTHWKIKTKGLEADCKTVEELIQLIRRLV